ncbi:MAG: prepilin-type N-terminal cleavage/methylation domain-containing protein [Bacilli bacterium]|nr:prepilin-type N-terminal cleavage/methylation domain-containing protein [Bacilli bacterium]
MKKGFTLIELLAVIVILAIIAVITTPIILNVIEDSKEKAFDIEASNIEKAAEYYLTDDFKIADLNDYEEYYIKVSDLAGVLDPITDDIKDNYVVVKKSGNSISYYYTGRDDNPYTYSDNETLKAIIENNIGSHIANNVVVNGLTVNKVIGTKADKKTIKNWVYYSGQLWQVLETTDNYVKLITANSVTSIAYGTTSDWDTSWVRKWLNEIDDTSNKDGIYYHNLSRADLLLDGSFCLDEPSGVTVSSDVVTAFTKISTCSSVSTDKIGLMTFEDYAYSLDGINGGTGALGNSFIDENEREWTISPATIIGGAANRMWSVTYDAPSYLAYTGHTASTNGSYGEGVRPVIYLSNDLLVENNRDLDYGQITNPYKLVGEQTAENSGLLNMVTIGSYVYISEENNPYTTTTENVTDNISYTYDKTKVRYRVIGINNDGSTKLQRADILRGLPSTIAINSDKYLAYYYNESTCDYSVTIYTGCSGNNYFSISGSGSYSYTDSENIGYFLNNTINGYYTWLSEEVQNNIIEETWNLAVSSFGIDYTQSLNKDTSGIYPNTLNDGMIEANIGLISWGDIFSGNDLNIAYWYLNRQLNSSSSVSYISAAGDANTTYASTSWSGVRPVINLVSTVSINSGDGTSNNPYILQF